VYLGLESTGLTCAIGIGDIKERAMMATTFAKSAPDHIYGLDSSNWIPVMGNRDVVELWGIGKRTATRLAAHDLRTVTDLALADRDDFAAWFGPTIGPRLRVLARGGSSRAITTEPWLAQSKSRQVTFAATSLTVMRSGKRLPRWPANRVRRSKPVGDK
jgi:DNA polymerase-4